MLIDYFFHSFFIHHSAGSVCVAGIFAGLNVRLIGALLGILCGRFRMNKWKILLALEAARRKTKEFLHVLMLYRLKSCGRN
jgi:hypothetical protein